MALFYGFLIGVIFIIFVYPLITDIYSIIAQGVEYINTIIACKTARLQITLQKEQAKIEGGEQTLAMGFHYNEDEDEYWDDDDDDEYWDEDE